MALFSFRGKPAWESRDHAERAAAVAGATDDALLSLLPDLARSDESAQVRRAAIRRLVDLPLLGDRARNDSDALVREAAGERYRALLAGAIEPRLPLTDRERVLRTEDDAEVLAFVAQQSPDSDLRRLALERSTRPGLLLDRCTRDPDPALRLWLLSRIDAIAPLERIAEASRKSDKRLSHAARERAAQLRRAAGDPLALREQALGIADDLDRLRRERPEDTRKRFDGLLAEWAALAPRLEASLVLRVQGYVEALRAVLDPAPAPPASASVLQVQAPSPAPPPEEGIVDRPREPDPELLALAIEAEGHVGDLDPDALDTLRRRHAQAWERQREHLAAEIDARLRFDAALAATRERHARETDAARQRSTALGHALDSLEAAVTAQQAQLARDRRAEIESMRTSGLPPALARRLAAVDESYEALVRWQHWSNNKVRARLCEEIETIAAAGAHPDAVATRVREAQAEWQRLDASERLDATAAAKIGLARRFRAVCHRALAPARSYFEKRGELRQRQREGMDALLARAEGELPADPGQATALRRALVEAMRGMDALDPRQRAGLGKRLRTGLDRLDAQRSARSDEATAEKRKLIANLRRQLAQADPAAALILAREAQAKLAAMPRADRAAEETVRAELAALVDPLFEHERSEREGAQAREQERTRGQAAVLDELAQLASGEAEGLRHADARIAALAQRWKELAAPAPVQPAAREVRDKRDFSGRREARDAGRPARSPRDDRGRDDERRFDAAVARVREAQKTALAHARRTETARALQLAAACAAVEAAALGGEPLEAALNALDAEADAVTHSGLRARVARLRGWREQPPTGEALLAESESAQTRLAQFALRAEALLGVESPPEWRDQRRAWQMRKLAERMSGAILPEAPRERQEVLDAWLTIGPLPTSARAAFAARIEPALVGAA